MTILGQMACAEKMQMSELRYYGRILVLVKLGEILTRDVKSTLLQTWQCRVTGFRRNSLISGRKNRHNTVVFQIYAPRDGRCRCSLAIHAFERFAFSFTF